MLARVHVDAGWGPELLRALGEAHCVALRRDDETVDVFLPQEIDHGEARAELRFFLSAWALDHPHANLRIDRFG